MKCQLAIITAASLLVVAAPAVAKPVSHSQHRHRCRHDCQVARHHRSHQVPAHKRHIKKPETITPYLESEWCGEEEWCEGTKEEATAAEEEALEEATEKEATEAEATSEEATEKEATAEEATEDEATAEES